MAAATSGAASRSNYMNSGIIAAAVIGAILFVAIGGAIAFILFRRGRRRRRDKDRPRVQVRPLDAVSIHSIEDEPDYIDSNIHYPAPAHVRNQRRPGQPDPHTPGWSRSRSREDLSHAPELTQVRLGALANDTPDPRPPQSQMGSSPPPYRKQY